MWWSGLGTMRLILLYNTDHGMKNGDDMMVFSYHVPPKLVSFPSYSLWMKHINHRHDKHQPLYNCKACKCLTSNGICQLKLVSYPYANVKLGVSNYQKHGDTTVNIKLMLEKQGGARWYALYLVRSLAISIANVFKNHFPCSAWCFIAVSVATSLFLSYMLQWRI